MTAPQSRSRQKCTGFHHSYFEPKRLNHIANFVSKIRIYFYFLVTAIIIQIISLLDFNEDYIVRRNTSNL